MKYQLQLGTKILIYLLGIILYPIFKIILSISSEKHDKVADNHPIRIYKNITEIRITFIIKTGNYLEFLTPKTMQLLRGIKSKITKDENDESVSTFPSNKSFGQLSNISPKNFNFFRTKYVRPSPAAAF